MNNHHLYIESYLLGELTGQDLVDFENALERDLELAEAVVKHREMLQRLDAYRIRSVVKSAITPQRGPWWPLTATRWMGGLAILLLTVLTFIWYGYPTSKVRPTKPHPDPKSSPSMRPKTAPTASPELKAPPTDSTP